MKKTLLALCLFSGTALAQTPTQCLVSSTWVPCSLITGVQEAQAVNAKVSAGSGTTITNAFTNSTTAGDAILCIGFESAAAVPVFTDGQSNTYAVIASSSAAPGYTIALANNIVGGTTDTITLTTTSGAASFACHELKGAVLAGQAWDLSNGQQGTAASITFAATTASVPNEMVFLGVGLGGGTVNATPTLGGNSTSLVTVDAANSAVTGGAALSIMYAAHASLSSALTFAQTVSLNASQTFSGALVSVKPVIMPTILSGISQTDPANGVAYGQGRNIPPNIDTAGNLWVSQQPGLRPASYEASANFAASSTTDNACIYGNSTDTVVVYEVQVNGTQTTAGIVNAQLIRRSAAETGGTSANMTAVRGDVTNYAAASTTPVSYTGTGPTAGAAVGTVGQQYTAFLAAATAVPNDAFIWSGRLKPQVLIGTGQGLCVTLGGALTGGNMDVTFRWEEIKNISE